jgi:hypothetical protein
LEDEFGDLQEALLRNFYKEVSIEKLQIYFRGKFSLDNPYY